MPYFFLDANGNYYEALTDKATPAGHTAVAQRPDQHATWNGSGWDAGTPPAPTEGEVRDEAERRMKLLVASYTDAERETWAEQTLEALEYSRNPLTTTALEAPLLFELAAGRGITEAEMATRILANRQAFKSAAANLLRKQVEILAMDPIPADYADDARWT